MASIRTLLNCPCDPVVERSCGWDAVPVNVRLLRSCRWAIEILEGVRHVALIRFETVE